MIGGEMTLVVIMEVYGLFQIHLIQVSFADAFMSCKKII